MTVLRVGETVRLRSVREGDAEPLFALVDANRGYLREWLPWLDANRSASFTLEFIRSASALERQGKAFVGVIEEAGELCGTAGFNSIDPANRAAEIGYWLRRDRQGRGIVTRCCEVLVSYGFDDLGLNRIVIPVAVGNRRSRAIPERLGFRLEGTLREAEWLYDHFVDHAVYSLLRREHRERRP